MNAKIVCYTLKKADDKIRSKFKREFFGYEDKSNRGQYNYKREGLVNQILNLRPVRSTIIVQNKDVNKVIKLLKKYDAEIKLYDIIINENELKSTSTTDT
jgi:mRNA-degrading endonuclease RelE of RelBE toxin-antitoxin system